MYSEGIPPETLEKLFVKPISSVEEGLKITLSKHGEDARIAVMPRGPYVLPRLE
jgi:nickel-dependent lactate racemase